MNKEEFDNAEYSAEFNADNIAEYSAENNIEYCTAVNDSATQTGIYIHIPFCVQKCAYCDFLSAPSDEITKRKYVAALIKEIQSSDASRELRVPTIFLGGGTPSILDAECISDIMNALKERFHIIEGAEITIECNPGTVTFDKLKAYKNAGINRISFGLQSANNIELKSIGRIHTYEQFIESYELAKRAGFDNINIDLISALPDQTIDSWKVTLEKIIELEPSHISAYSLIVEEGTKLFDQVEKEKMQGIDRIPDEETERNMYYLTNELLEKAGYIHYEISNYAKPGYECRHNLTYWAPDNYIGFGIGAASYIGDIRYKNTDDLNLYMEWAQNASDIEAGRAGIEVIGSIEGMTGHDALATDGAATDGVATDGVATDGKTTDRKIKLMDLSDIRVDVTVLTRENKMEEFMFLGLRRINGISVVEFKRRFGLDYDSVYDKITKKFIEMGLLIQKDDRIYLSERGIDVSNSVMAEFLLD